MGLMEHYMLCWVIAPQGLIHFTLGLVATYQPAGKRLWAPWQVFHSFKGLLHLRYFLVFKEALFGLYLQQYIYEYLQNLLIKQAGTDYTMRFIGRRANGDLFADLYSLPFDVYVGDPYRLAFTNYVGTALGGTVFSKNPVVAVVDRGDNVVPTATFVNPDSSSRVSSNSISDSTLMAAASAGDPGIIRAVLTRCPFSELADSPDDVAALLQPSVRTVAALQEGAATFEGLYLNRSGYPYEITFYSNMVRFVVKTF
jgi:hypothetical protein